MVAPGGSTARVNVCVSRCILVNGFGTGASNRPVVVVLVADDDTNDALVDADIVDD
jgi:hypothetical protein